jgi:hypothetical protein
MKTKSSTYLVFLIAMQVILFGCGQTKKSEANSENGTEISQKELKDSTPQRVDSTNGTVGQVNLSFLDSINNKYELSIEQIKRNTLIDNVYYTGMFSDARFTGDTVIDLYHGFKGAIIDYDDRLVCSRKFLVILNEANQNTDEKIVFTECDQDESSSNRTVNYKFINDSSFETIETYFPANSERLKPKPKVKKFIWRINHVGSIEVNSYSDISASKPVKLEEKIIDTIFKLKEVKERAKYVEQQTRGERRLKVWVEDTPNLRDHKYYWIKVGEDNGTNLVTHFNFYVYPDSMRIMYYDITSDSVLTLNKWRKVSGQ